MTQSTPKASPYFELPIKDISWEKSSMCNPFRWLPLSIPIITNALPPVPP